MTEDKDTVLVENDVPLVEIVTSAQHRQWVIFAVVASLEGRTAPGEGVTPD